MSEKSFEIILKEYKTWLIEKKQYQSGTISSRMANLKTLSENYDLLKEYADNECLSVLDELSMSRGDSEPKTTIVINGDYYNGLATYRQALKLFVSFLKDINYIAPVPSFQSSSIFIGSFDDFKKYVGPKCRNEVNIFCKSERVKHNSICEYCGNPGVLESAHIVERPVMMKEILDKYYKDGNGMYKVNLDEFFQKFREAHLPIEEHIFFLCKNCHNKLDKTNTLTIAEIKAKRKLGSSN